MFDHTPAVARALEIAQLWAGRDRVGAFTCAHLLQGLLEEAEGRPWLLLNQAGIDPAALARSYAGEEPLALDQARPTALAREALLRARELSRALGEERTVASEHLLLALLETDGELRLSLEKQGLRFAEIEAALWSSQGPPIQLDEPLNLDAVPDDPHVGRLLDANANRAREALRVLEDYTRFVLDDAFLSGEWKRLRHQLTEALCVLPAGWLLANRDTLGDVGTVLSTSGERQRGTALDVVRAAAKRLQEALRSLEEYGKLHGPELAGHIEALRYRSYTLERTLLLGVDGRARLASVRVCVLITRELCRHSPLETARRAMAGAGMIQLREKNGDDLAALELARDLRRATRDAGALFIVNDRPDLAKLSGADGVHLGQDDLPPRDARRIVGPDALIGVSTHNLEQLRRAILDGASYVGVGPTFASSTKDFAELAGVEYLREAAAATSLPMFAIGGITAENAMQVVAAGSPRIAVSAAVCRADDPYQAVRLFIAATSRQSR